MKIIPLCLRILNLYCLLKSFCKEKWLNHCLCGCVCEEKWAHRNVCLKKWEKKMAFSRKKLGEKKGYQLICSRFNQTK